MNAPSLLREPLAFEPATGCETGWLSADGKWSICSIGVDAGRTFEIWRELALEPGQRRPRWVRVQVGLPTLEHAEAVANALAEQVAA